MRDWEPHFLTGSRLEKITKVLSHRQPGIHPVLENIHDPHNVSAIFRTCDATGVPAVSLLYNYEKFPKIGKKSSASAFKWMMKEKYRTVDECYGKLKESGFIIAASNCSPKAVSLYEIDFTKSVAFVLGNEHRGVSEEGIIKADFDFYIPMFGMVQSLNVSVAAAVILYEAARQRHNAGMYDSPQYSSEQLNELIQKWSSKKR